MQVSYKLQELSEQYDMSCEEMMEQATFDSLAPSICMNEERDSMFDAQEVREKLEDHDDRVKEGEAEIRILCSSTGDNADFCVFVVIHNGEQIIFNNDQEEQALSQYMLLR